MAKACVCNCGTITPAARFCRACGKSLDGSDLVEILSAAVVEALNQGKFVRSSPKFFKSTGRKHFTLN